MSPEAEAIGKVAVVGSGAVGGYYGARLARAGQEVSFLMRRDLAAARRQGLKVRIVVEGDEKERFRVDPVEAFGSTVEIGPVDVVMVGVKATARGALEWLVPPLLHEETRILTLQNGLGAEEHLGGLFGPERVMGGLCFVCLNRVAPASIECYLPGTLSIGSFGRPPDRRAEAIASAFRAAGVKCTVAQNLSEARWRKLVWNVPFNGLSIAAGGITTDRILEDPELLGEVHALMAEVQSAAAHFGHDIPDAFLKRQVEETRGMGAYKPSSFVDFLEGRSVEIDAIWGEPLSRARAAGLAMPRLAELHRRLRQVCPGNG